ncbi:aminopeptidase N [Streptomyces sp. TRM 70351]|uniref:aminopeptidase N n=1 Tax=Streptomyces sp. TRM 70351 TaxID=3116552 RepID=UPI002E7C3F15|nr:aminopeptidase N [Streptomyces sp. TRM 70351]MEE1930497.1 aminopeptidase N [Streptomyces sp. TRM 70351]
MSVLTRGEAQTRAALLDVHRYTIDLDLTRGDDVFGAVTTIRFTARAAGDTFAEVRPAALHRAELDGRALDADAFDGGRLALTGLAPGEHELRVTADMRYSHTGEGMHRFTDPADGLSYLYTQCCQSDAPLVFACFDQPDLKAEFAVAVTAPEDWTVLGNGVATQDPGRPGRWTCALTPRLSTYLMAVAAGPYHSVRTEHAGLPFGLHVRRSLAEHLDADAGELFAITRRCYDRYHELFDEPYPFDSYDQAFVPEFNSGAMENPGLVTFRDEFVFRSAVTDNQRQTRGMVIAHEMAHMWFGDLVTLRWWDDIWLNESFAEYMGFQVLAEATHWTDTWTDFAIARKSWGYDADQRPSTHPVAPDPRDVPDTEAARLNFDGISYAKGASALRQLVAWLGPGDFLAGINAHFARHRFGNATLADFLDSLSGASDKDVHTWAEHWLRTSGPDTLVPEVTATAQGGWRLGLRHEGTRPHRLLVGVYDRAEPDATGGAAEDGTPGRLVLRERTPVDVPQERGTTTLDFPGPRPGLVLLNDGDLTYAKIRLDPASWDTAREALSGLPDALTRAVVWNAARDMVRDGELPPGSYLEAVRAHLPRETDNAVVQAVLQFARTEVADRMLPPQRRPEALAALHAVCHELLERTAGDTGRGLRLIAVRGAVASATDPAGMAAWLRAGTVPGGPALDQELRWQLLHRLAVLGGATGEDIDAEARRDTSATGREGAARCRAALPTAEAKAAAWDAMFGPADALSNYLFTATAQGFWHAEHTGLVRPYAERYFTAAVELAGRRGASLAHFAATAAFPRTLAEPEVLRRGEACLAGDSVPPALRRPLADQLDDLRRALRVRTAAGAAAGRDGAAG